VLVIWNLFMQVIVTGSLGYDYIMDFPGRFADRIMPDKIHKLSLSFLVDKLSKQFGGTGANIAYTLKLLGVESLLLACAGEDFAEYKKHLERHGIVTTGITEHQRVTTSSYFVITDQDDNQIGSFYVGAMKYARDLSIAAVADSGNLSDSRNRTPPPHFVVIAPFASRVSYETRIYPKKHQARFEEASAAERIALADALSCTLQKIKKTMDDPDYNFFIHTAPAKATGPDYYHWHMEILPHTSTWAGLELGIGISVVAIPPEDAAAHLRNA